MQSNRFFWASIIFFALESSWIALSGLYSMAYDENTHFAIMKLYAEHHRLLPFWSAQPANSSQLGALTHDPSYLYRFLLSFPLRWIEPFIQTTTSQVLVIRFISILGFGIGLILFRKLLLKTGASKALVHTVLAIFLLFPMVPFLAAQINYDNIMFPLVALTLICGVNFLDKLKNEHRVDLLWLVLTLTLALFNSLVMYAALPVLLGVAIWALVAIIKQLRRQSWKKVWRTAIDSFSKVSLPVRLLVIGGFILGSGLFIQAYGVNMVLYHTPVPDCHQVLTVQECTAYGPWKRNYESHNDLLAGTLKYQYHPDIISFTVIDWIRQMSFQVFYALNGEVSHFQVGQPLPLPRILALIVAPVGMVLVFWKQRLLRRKYRYLGFLVFTSLTYVCVLWLREYTGFLYNGYAVAIQGRYLAPVLPTFCLVMAMAFSQALKRKVYLKAVFAWVAIFVLLFEGGGAMVFIARSDQYWYWPNAQVQRVNHNAQKVLKKFVIGA